MDPKLIAQVNLHNLSMKTYPGRGLIVGRDENNNIIQVCWIMGRGDDSRNRVYEKDDDTGRVWTVEADPSRPAQKPELTLYDAMDERPNVHIVSNGAQTADLIKNVDTLGSDDFAFEDVLMDWQYEDDPPNYTPRITGYAYCNREMGISTLCKPQWAWGDSDDYCDRLTFVPEIIGAGFGFCVTTYVDDAPKPKPLPSFRDKPFLVPLHGSILTIINRYWNALSEANKVSLAVKFIPRGGGKSVVHVVNKYPKLPRP